jgi:very-short-patch-repair endonuclease
MMRGLRLHETRRARDLRQNQTEAERLLWRRLRGRALAGFKFARQEPIGPYFADLVCRDERLIVDPRTAIRGDGATHSTDEERRRDARRAAFLAERGYRIARFVNHEVYGNIEGVLETILAALERRSTL